MAITFLLLRQLTKIDTITLDVSVAETYTGEVEVTEHPVEEGFNVVDHARAKPDMLTIEGVVSNTPLSMSQQRRLVQAASGVQFETTTQQDQIEGQPGYAEAAFAKLEELRKTGKLVTVLTKLKTYEEMVLVSLVVPRNSTTGDALRFTAVFKHIRVVKNKLTSATIAKEPKAKAKVKTGKQVPKPDEATKKKSIAYTIAEQTGLLSKLGIVKP